MRALESEVLHLSELLPALFDEPRAPPTPRSETEKVVERPAAQERSTGCWALVGEALMRSTFTLGPEPVVVVPLPPEPEAQPGPFTDDLDVLLARFSRLGLEEGEPEARSQAVAQDADPAPRSSDRKTGDPRSWTGSSWFTSLLFDLVTDPELDIE